MIKIHLKSLLDEYNLTITDLSESTGLARSTITPLVNNPADVKGLKIDTIDTLCDFFGINVEDLLTFKAEKNKYTIPRQWVDESIATIFVDMRKQIGAKYRHSMIALSLSHTTPNDDELSVSIRALAKSEIELASFKNAPSEEEFMDGDLFFRDFSHQPKEIQQQTTKVLVSNLTYLDFFKQNYSEARFFRAYWTNEGIFSERLYTFFYEYKNKKLSYIEEESMR